MNVESYLVRRATAPQQGVLTRYAASLACILLLCFPAFVNRSPLYFPDSRSYYMGGRAAIEKLVGMLHALGHAAGGGTGNVDATLLQARGVRSAFYSLLTYTLSQIGTPWMLIAVQSLLIVAVTGLVFRLYAGKSVGSFLATAACLTACTSLPWFTSFVMPDIFTPMLALSLGTLLISWRDIRPATRLCLLLLFGMSLVMHISNLPIALCLMVVGGLLARHSLRRSPMALASVAGVLVAAVMAMLVVSHVGFGEWSLTPKGAPFLTARSIDDGPGRLYLQQHCPDAGLAMCRHLDKLDLPSDQFIWGQDGTGVYSSVSAEEQAQLRREDKSLFLHAALEHPWMQLSAFLRNTGAQLVSFSVLDISLPNWAEITNDNITIHESGNHPALLYCISILNYVAVVAACFTFLWLWLTKHLPPNARHLILFSVAAVIVNAMVAGGLSMPSPRYEARIIWLLPFIALVLWNGSPLLTARKEARP